MIIKHSKRTYQCCARLNVHVKTVLIYVYDMQEEVFEMHLSYT